MHLHVPLTLSPVRRHPLAATDLQRLATRTASLLLAAYGIVCIVWAFSDSGAPGLLASLGFYALVGAVATELSPRLTGAVLVVGAPLGAAIALLARWLGGTYATTIHNGLLVALFAVPFAAGLALVAETFREQRLRR